MTVAADQSPVNYTFNLATYEGRKVRMVTLEGGVVWFVLADVCEILELGNPSQVATRLDDDEKGVISIDTPGGIQNVRAVSESGLYSVILGARTTDHTRAFKRWVTSVVLPSIRASGSYSVKPTPVLTPAQHLLEQAQVLLGLEARTEKVELAVANMPIFGNRKGLIHALGQRLGHAMGSYRKGWTCFKDRFGLAGYADLPDSRFDEGVKFLKAQIAAYEGTEPEVHPLDAPITAAHYEGIDA